MLSFNVITSAIRSESRDGFISHRTGQEKQRNFTPLFMNELQSLRSLPARLRILGNHHLVRLRAQTFHALCRVQNEIGTDAVLPFLELFQAGIYGVRIAVNEEDAEGAASVGRRAFRLATPLVRL